MKKIPVVVKPVVRRHIVDDDEEVHIVLADELAPAKHIGLVHAIPIPNKSIALPMKVAGTVYVLVLYNKHVTYPTGYYSSAIIYNQFQYNNLPHLSWSISLSPLRNISVHQRSPCPPLPLKHPQK